MIYKFLRKIASTCACAGMLILGFAAIPCSWARADDNPFQIDASQWMSFGHYKDAARRGLPGVTPTPPPAAAPKKITPPLAPATPVVAAPRRPIDLPVMPGLNDGFQVRVNATDRDLSTSNSPILGLNAEPDIHPSDKNWESPSAVRKNRFDADGNASPALNVRMTFLPNEKITPIPSPSHMSAQRRGNEQLLKKLRERKEAKSDDAAVIAAIKAYKKQQLEAIESDRQTMKALQDAIRSLGLQKKLGFMTGNGNQLTNAPPPASIEAPASTVIK